MTRAEALLACSYLASAEADAVLYGWPPRPDDEREEANRKSELSRQLVDDAALLTDDVERGWKRVMHWFGGGEL